MAMGKLIDLTGQRFGKMVVLERAANSAHGASRWLCRCECGNESIVRGLDLRRQTSSRCNQCRILAMGQPWTDYEKLAVGLLFRELGQRALAMVLGRTSQSVSSMASKLGCKDDRSTAMKKAWGRDDGTMLAANRRSGLARRGYIATTMHRENMAGSRRGKRQSKLSIDARRVGRIYARQVRFAKDFSEFLNQTIEG